MNFKNGIRCVSFRYAAVRNGAELCSIQAVDSPSIEMVSDAAIKTEIKGGFTVPPEVNWLTDLLRPYILIDGTEHPLGEFVISTVNETYENGTVHFNLEGYDKGAKVENTPLTNRLVLNSGRNYLEAVQALLIHCGIDRVIIEPCSDVLQTVREDWEVGESTQVVINAMLKEINYRSLWFDLAGNARLTKYRPPTAELATHTYRADEFSIIREGSSRTLDCYDAYNDFIVMVSSPDYTGPMVARSTNENPVSALSVQRIGRRTAPIVKLNNIASSAALQEYAENLRFKSLMTTEVVEFSTANTPHEVGEVLILDHPQLKGIYEEIGWSMTLEAGAEMKHKGKRVIYLD